MFVILGKFQLFIFICSGFQSLFANCAKTFVVPTNRKSCCGSGSLFREAKDVVAYLILGLKVKQFLNL
jgi:hypothetical protein